MKKLSIFMLVVLSFNLWLSSAAYAADFADPFPLPELTGDWRTDYVAVAESQLGYTEADDESSYFGDWAGQTYRPWCSEFAAWCAVQAGIPETIIPIARSTGGYRNFFVDVNRYFFVEGGINGNNTDFLEEFDRVDIKTIPISEAEKGDLILAETDGNISNGPDHTAIFLSYEDGIINCISGNSSDNVEYGTIMLEKIHAICKPDFENEDEYFEEDEDIDDEESTTSADITTETTTAVSSTGGSSSSSSKATTEATTETTTDVIEITTEATISIISNKVKVSIGSNTVVVGDNSYTIDAAPYIQISSNSTLVPLRFVVIAILGGDVEDAGNSSIIDWNGATKTASVTADNKVIQFTGGSSEMIVDGVNKTMDNGVKAEIKDGRMYIPFRALGEALGVDVGWDSDTKTAIYKTK